MASEVLKVVREQVNGVWCSIHVSKDGRIRINTGADDQRPDSDGLHAFLPTCVAEMCGGSVYTYHKFCGSCRRRMGSLGEVKRCCPWCGHVVGHYVFAMGVYAIELSFGAARERFPEMLPTTLETLHDYQTRCEARNADSQRVRDDLRLQLQTDGQKVARIGPASPAV